MSIETENMFSQLATKDELHKEISRLDEKHVEHSEQFRRIINHVGTHSTQLRDHNHSITKLEKTA